MDPLTCPARAHPPPRCRTRSRKTSGTGACRARESARRRARQSAACATGLPACTASLARRTSRIPARATARSARRFPSTVCAERGRLPRSLTRAVSAWHCPCASWCPVRLVAALGSAYRAVPREAEKDKPMAIRCATAQVARRRCAGAGPSGGSARPKSKSRAGKTDACGTPRAVAIALDRPRVPCSEYDECVLDEQRYYSTFRPTLVPL